MTLDMEEVVARLSEFADWMARGDDGGEGSVLMAASVAQEHSSDLRAILSERRKMVEALESVVTHYEMLVRLTHGSAVYEVEKVSGKRVRRSLREVLAVEAEAGAVTARAALTGSREQEADNA